VRSRIKLRLRPLADDDKVVPNAEHLMASRTAHQLPIRHGIGDDLFALVAVGAGDVNEYRLAGHIPHLQA
jgi:hypothetical protein